MTDNTACSTFDLESLIWTVMKCLAILFLSANIVNMLITPNWIKNLPSIYTPLPLLNGLEMIIPKPKHWIESLCLQFYNFAQLYGDVYQIKFGTKLIVVANSYDSVKKLWCTKNVKANNSRPVSYSFHKVLSKGGIYTIGTTPIGESYKRARKHVSEKVLCEKRNNDFNYVIMNEAADEMIDKIITTSSREIGNNCISSDLLKEAQYFHLKIALWLTYGFVFDMNDLVHQHLADQIIEVENKITKVRSHVQNAQDYMPSFIRYIVEMVSNTGAELKALYNIREKYLSIFYTFSQALYDDINNGRLLAKIERESQTNKNKSMVAINTIEDLKCTMMYNYFDTAKEKLTLADVTSECLTMVSAGLDNTPLNFKYGMHQLANYHPDMWDLAFEDLIQYYDNDHKRAYRECATETKSEYVRAIVQETLRLFTVLPMSLPREVTSDVIYQDAIIPKGTTLFMNCWAANHDESKFPEPMEFRPERWLTSSIGSDKVEVLDTNVKHFAFGIGCRKCLGSSFATRELYILFAKMILRFRPIRSNSMKTATSDFPPSNPLELNRFPESLAIEPRSFDIVLEGRDWLQNDVLGI